MEFLEHRSYHVKKIFNVIFVKLRVSWWTRSRFMETPQYMEKML
jgi:hypothetical protein